MNHEDPLSGETYFWMPKTKLSEAQVKLKTETINLKNMLYKINKMANEVKNRISPRKIDDFKQSTLKINECLEHLINTFKAIQNEEPHQTSKRKSESIGDGPKAKEHKS